MIDFAMKIIYLCKRNQIIQQMHTRLKINMLFKKELSSFNVAISSTTHTRWSILNYNKGNIGQEMK